MLDYETCPSLFAMVDGQAKEYHTDLSALDEKVRAALEKYAAPVAGWFASSGPTSVPASTFLSQLV